MRQGSQRATESQDQKINQRGRFLKMRKTSVISIFATVLLGASLMSAQATRPGVCGVGDDANPCSRTAPCKTWAGAISKTAPGGEIDALDPGGFGAVTITKSITFDGGGGQVASILITGTSAIVVAAGSNDIVIIRNLRLDGLRGAGNANAGVNGIRFLSGAELHIEHCSIFGFNNAGIDVETSTASKFFVDDTTSTDNAFAGMFITSTVSVSADVYRSRFRANGIHGLWSKDNSNTSVIDSDASGNPGEGFLAFASNGTSTLNLFNSTSNANGTGVQAGGAGSLTATVTVAGTSLTNNGTGFSTGAGGTIKSFSNNYNSGSGTPTGGQNIPVQ